MRVILIYDVEAGRTQKFYKVCKQYLTWIQNSVFEGQLSPGKKSELEERIDDMVEDGESVVIYSWRGSNYERKIYGNAPDPDEVLL